MLLEKHWYHAYEIYKCSYHLDSTIPRGSVTSLLLGIAIFRGSVSFIRGLESKALDNSLPRYYFHKEVSTTNRLSIHVLKPTFNVANHLNAWEAARYQWTFMLGSPPTKWWSKVENIEGLTAPPFFQVYRCFKHPQNGKIKQTSWSTIVLSTCLPPAVFFAHHGIISSMQS